MTPQRLTKRATAVSGEHEIAWNDVGYLDQLSSREILSRAHETTIQRTTRIDAAPAQKEPTFAAHSWSVTVARLWSALCASEQAKSPKITIDNFEYQENTLELSAVLALVAGADNQARRGYGGTLVVLPMQGSRIISLDSVLVQLSGGNFSIDPRPHG
jgi:hypothetical protein